MIKFLYRNKKQKRIKEISEFTSGAWIYVVDPTQEEIKYLVETFSLEEGHIKDALDINEVPRLELEDSTVYVFNRFATTVANRIETFPILTIIKKNVYITVSSSDFPRLDRLLSDKYVFQTTHNTSLFTKFILQLTHTYNSHLTIIAKKVRSSQVNIEKIKNKDIVQFITLENVLNEFILALVRNNSILNSILSRKLISANEAERDVIEDLAHYNNQLVQIANENLRTIINIREASSTIMTNNLNRIIKLFTALTVILTLPTIIASFYGMNVRLPFAENPFAFFIILILTLIIVVSLVALFIKKDWL